jgi:superfamily II DNA or RNA helicase
MKKNALPKPRPEPRPKADNFRGRIDSEKLVLSVNEANIAALKVMVERAKKVRAAGEKGLHEEQIIAIEKVIADMELGNPQNYVVLPPGFGKTIMQVYIILALMQTNGLLHNRQIIWIAPNHTLVMKNIDELKIHAKELEPYVAVYTGEKKDPIPENGIICCTPLMFARLTHREKENKTASDLEHLLDLEEVEGKDADKKDEKKKKKKEKNSDAELRISAETVLIPDEIHALLSALRDGALKEFRDSGVCEVGATATPILADGRSVGDVAFDGRKPSAEMGFHEAVHKGYLCNIAPMIMNVKTEFGKEERAELKDKLKEKHDKAKPAEIQSRLNRIVNRNSLHTRMKMVVAAWGKDINPYSGENLFLQQGIVFCPRISVAVSMAEEYNKLYGGKIPAGHQVAACIHSKMTPAERKDILDRYKAGKIYILTNVRCLATGFDYPKIGFVEILWETMSQPLLAQEIGRGSRIDPENRNKILLARQWADLSRNRNCALISEAIESVKPLYNYNFTPSEGTKKVRYDIKHSTDKAEVRVHITPIEIETITRAKQATLDPNKTLLPPPEHSLNSMVTAQTFCKIFEENNPGIKHSELRSYVDRLLKSLTDEFPYEDMLLGEKYTTSMNVDIMMAGTQEGNRWHFDYTEFYQYFIEHVNVKHKTNKFGEVKASIDDFCEPNDYDSWKNIEDSVLTSSESPAKTVRAALDNLRSELVDQYRTKQGTIKDESRRYNEVFTSSHNIPFRVRSPIDEQPVAREDSVISYLKTQGIDLSGIKQTISEAFPNRKTRKEMGEGEYLNINNLKTFLDNYKSMLVIDPFREKDLRNIEQLLRDEAKDIPYSDRPMNTRSGVCVIRKEGSNEIMVNLGDLKYYLFERTQALLTERFEKMRNSVDTNKKTFPRELDNSQDVYIQVPQRGLHIWYENIIHKHGYKFDDDSKRTYRINSFQNYVSAISKLSAALPADEAKMANSFEVEKYSKDLSGNDLYLVKYQDKYFLNGKEVTLDAVKGYSHEESLLFKSAFVDDEIRYYTHLENFVTHLLINDLTYSRRLHHEDKNQMDSAVSPATFFSQMNNYGLHIQPAISANIEATVQSSARQVIEAHPFEYQGPYSASLYIEKLRLAAYVTAFSKEITEEMQEKGAEDYVYGVWPVIPKTDFVDYMQKLALQNLHDLDSRLNDERMLGISRQTPEQMVERINTLHDISCAHVGLLIDDKFRQAHNERLSNEEHRVQVMIFKAIEYDNRDSMLRLINGHPELLNKALDNFEMTPLFYAAQQGASMCFVALCNKLSFDQINAHNPAGKHILHQAANPDINRLYPDAGLKNVQYLIENVRIPLSVHDLNTYITPMDSIVGDCRRTGQRDCILHPKTYQYLKDNGMKPTRNIDENHVVNDLAWSDEVAMKLTRKAA